MDGSLKGLTIRAPNGAKKGRKTLPLLCVFWHECIYGKERDSVSERVCDARRPQTLYTLAINSPRTQMTIDNTIDDTNDNTIDNTKTNDKAINDYTNDNTNGNTNANTPF